MRDYGSLPASSGTASQSPPQKVQKRSRTEANKVVLILFLSAVHIIVCMVLFHKNTKYHSTKHRPSLDAPRHDPKSAYRKHAHKYNETTTIPTRNCSSRSETSCFQWNSQAWLDGPRLGNKHDPLLTEKFGFDLILDNPPLLSIDGAMPLVLKQSLCHEDSRFLNWTDHGSDEKTLHFWSLRLAYMAFHVHQHRPAVREAKARYECQGTCPQVLQKRQIGNFDYECPETKYFVVPMGTSGLGAVMRLGAANALIAGIATNRTVLFVNNASSGPKFLRQPWTQASCDRHDFQCFYLPTSPCVVVEKDLADAYVLQRGEQRRMFRFGILPEEHNNTRVITVDAITRPQRLPENFRQNMLRIVSDIIDQLRESNPQDGRIGMLQKAAQLILEVEEEDPSRPYYYTGGISKVHHAAVFYTMRPNPLASRRLAETMDHILPNDFNSDFALGLPIRASDKCLVESECLSFDQYMKLMSQIWRKNEALINMSAVSKRVEPLANIVLTSESENILEARLQYDTNLTLKRSVPFPFRFVTNEHDVMQGTGLPEDFGARRNVTADDVMLSAVGSLKTQLMARFTVGNCCSNFHLLLFDFLRDGCGAAQDNIGQCLQENEDPEFRVCCQWSKTDECQQKKENAENTTKRE